VIGGFVSASRYYSELAAREVIAAKLEASLAEARLEVLRRQLSPHFSVQHAERHFSSRSSAATTTQ
jgi:hypothetical protein